MFFSQWFSVNRKSGLCVRRGGLCVTKNYEITQSATEYSQTCLPARQGFTEYF